MSHNYFANKWADIKNKTASGGALERVLFVERGAEPQTQRQQELYYFFLFIARILRRRKIADVLELGAGRGTISLYLAVYFGLKPALLDNSDDAMVIARESFHNYNLPANFVVSDALSTKLPSSSFDAVLSIGLAEHFDQVDQLFAEQWRLLRPGGIMISLNIPKKFSIQFLNVWLRLVKKIFGRYRESVSKDYYRNRLSPQEYAAAVRRAGFSRVEITHVSPFPLYTPLSPAAERLVTKINKYLLKIRNWFMDYPYQVNRYLARAHFLVAYKD